MSVRFRCTCGNVIQLTLDHADKRVPCPQCGKAFRIPRAKLETAAKPSPPAGIAQRENANEKKLDLLADMKLSDMTVLPDPRAARPPLAQPAPVVLDDHACPSCRKVYPGTTQICIDCGIKIKTGRSLILAHEGDLDRVYDDAERIIRAVSWLIAGVYPIGSEAYGTKKPYAIFGIVIITVFISSVFAAAFVSGSSKMQSAKQLMLWLPNPTPDPKLIVLYHEIMPYGDTIAFDAKYAELEKANPPGDGTSLTSTASWFGKSYRNDLLIQTNAALPVEARPIGEFRVHQLLTNTLLHGGLFFHLAGNMFFLVIFGMRVNALIGNPLTAITYPLLAIGASLIYLVAESGGSPVPCIGASGAVMGLAGMYIVLFPVHKMHMAAWWRWGLIGWFKLHYKIWAVRGFWVVLFYIAFDVVATLIGIEDGVAHWAHLGGFLVGIAIALLLLITRLVNAHGADVLSILLGRHAWLLVGKPRIAAHRPQPPLAEPQSVQEA